MARPWKLIAIYGKSYIDGIPFCDKCGKILEAGTKCWSKGMGTRKKIKRVLRGNHKENGRCRFVCIKCWNKLWM